jgi:tetratricopeptide (TPR) repeat protein
MAEQRKKTKGKPSKTKKNQVAESGRMQYLPTLQPHSSGNLKFLLLVLALTFILYIRALSNGFTNWDDVLYVTQNPLLKDLSLKGIKAIFSTPVVSNYHPLTIISLALNYQLAELTPWSYHLTSILLHLVNTSLVFWFILYLSSGNRWVSTSVALLFAIHPMHVESVAWISERKDLLYTLFYVGALLVYVQYLRKKEVRHLVILTVLGAISLLCKPAAIVLPFSLLLLDYYYKRQWNWSWILEKLPLFVLSGVITYVTLIIQSKRAIASVDLYNFIERICFAGFGLIWYLLKLIVPYPLSSLHPFPRELTIWYYLATFAAVAGIIFLVLKVRSRIILFGFGFYIVNLLLVLQLISIGNAVVAERYTYVPYIGIFFLIGMEVYKALNSGWKKYQTVVLGIAGVWVLILSGITWMRIPVWKSSETLWDDVLNHYPTSPRAWTNQSLYYFDLKDWPKTIEGLTNALKSDPSYADALEWRSRTYIETAEYDKALADASTFHKLRPEKTIGLFLIARSNDGLGNTDEALNAYNELIPLEPNTAEYINNRGVIYFNKLKKYEEAKKDFEQCIRINPSNGMYFLNLSRCYYMMGDNENAKTNAVQALKLGTAVDDAYQRLIGLE